MTTKTKHKQLHDITRSCMFEDDQALQSFDLELFFKTQYSGNGIFAVTVLEVFSQEVQLSVVCSFWWLQSINRTAVTKVRV